MPNTVPSAGVQQPLSALVSDFPLCVLPGFLRGICRAGQAQPHLSQASPGPPAMHAASALCSPPATQFTFCSSFFSSSSSSSSTPSLRLCLSVTYTLPGSWTGSQGSVASRHPAPARPSPSCPAAPRRLSLTELQMTWPPRPLGHKLRMPVRTAQAQAGHLAAGCRAGALQTPVASPPHLLPALVRALAPPWGTALPVPTAPGPFP